MKKAYILLFGAMAGFVILYIIERMTSPAPGFFLGTGNNADVNNQPTVAAPKVYNNLKNQVILHKGQDLYPNEVEVLQRFINVYPGVNPVPVTGFFDELTEAAVTQVTGKGSTSLQEFRFVWMQNKGLNLVAERIVKGQA